MELELDKLDKTKEYRTPCNHKNAGVINIYPFDLMVCLDCGYKFNITQLKMV